MRDATPCAQQRDCIELFLSRLIFFYPFALDFQPVVLSLLLRVKTKGGGKKSTFGFMSRTQIIFLQGQHCVRCSPMDCLHLLIIHSFSGSSPLPSKGLNGPHVSSRNMRELDCIGMTRRMNGLNFNMALSFASLTSLLFDKKTICCQRKRAWQKQDRPTRKFYSLKTSLGHMLTDEISLWKNPSEQEGPAVCWGTGTNHASFIPIHFCLWKNFLIGLSFQCQRRNFN